MARAQKLAARGAKLNGFGHNGHCSAAWVARIGCEDGRIQECIFVIQPSQASRVAGPLEILPTGSRRPWAPPGEPKTEAKADGAGNQAEKCDAVDSQAER